MSAPVIEKESINFDKAFWIVSPSMPNAKAVVADAKTFRI